MSSFERPPDRATSPSKASFGSETPRTASAPWAEYLKTVPNDYLQCWPVSKRVNSSKVDAEDATLIKQIELATAQMRFGIQFDVVGQLAKS